MVWVVITTIPQLGHPQQERCYFLLACLLAFFLLLLFVVSETHPWGFLNFVMINFSTLWWFSSVENLFCLVVSTLVRLEWPSTHQCTIQKSRSGISSMGWNCPPQWSVYLVSILIFFFCSFFSLAQFFFGNFLIHTFFG